MVVCVVAAVQAAIIELAAVTCISDRTYGLDVTANPVGNCFV